MPKPIPEKQAYTVAEFEAAFGYTHTRVYQLIRDGELKSYKEGRRRMISARAGREHIERREREAAPKDAA